MHIRFRLGAVVAFLVLVLVLHEAHELGHHFMAWILCGCPGERDFLVWKLCDGCAAGSNSIIAGFAGPFVTYTFMWIGYVLMKPSNEVRKRLMGFLLVMGSLPLPRLMGAADRGGDEIGTMRKLIDEGSSFKGAPVIAGGLLLLVMMAPPLWRAWKTIGRKHKILVYLAFLVVPLIFDKIVVEKLLNQEMVGGGVLMSPVWGGMPLLIIIYDVVLILALLITHKRLQTFISQP